MPVAYGLAWMSGDRRGPDNCVWAYLASCDAVVVRPHARCLLMLRSSIKAYITEARSNYTQQVLAIERNVGVIKKLQVVIFMSKLS